ncbi:unnamed protein product [Peronospora effusa]|nr:unnamed protein product [Peronospora effusa]
MVEPHVSLKKGLPWLKRLQGALEDDDSSDSSSNSTNTTSVKVIKKKKQKKKLEKEGNGRRRVTKRQRQQEDNDSDYESLEDSSSTKETQRRMLTKKDQTDTFVRRKRPYRAPKKEQNKTPNATISVVAKATALREKRKHNLDKRRGIARENDRIALNVTQDESSRAIQLVRNEQTISTGKKVDIEVNSERWKRMSRGLRRRNLINKLSAKCQLLKTAALSTIKTKNPDVDLSNVAMGNALHSLKQDEEEDDVGPRFVAEVTAAELTKHDDNEEELMTTPEPVEHEEHDKVLLAVTKNDTSELDKLKRNGEPESTPSRSDKAEISVIAKAETTEDAKKVVITAKSEEAGAAQESLGAALTFTVTSSYPVKHEFHDKIKDEVLVDVKAAPRLVKKEGNDERQTESHVVTQNASGSVKSEDGAEKNSSEEKRKDLVLEVMPIPRRRMKAGVSTAFATAESFVIPKRSCGNSDKGETAVAQVSRAKTSKPHASFDKNSLGPPEFVSMPPLPTPGSSPKLSKVVDPMRPVSKRLKNPVPVKKNASICRQDQALMRLSRKRNSIFMAAMELTSQAPDFRSNMGQMMGYEVYDVDGKALPDLIPRLSCATKREMASNRESYAASFFGVSLSVPKAIEKASPAVYECSSNDLEIRKINCYEELRFKRSEDREYYQRRMYGTAFVPQILRGWITLMVRNARFERKSTGVRFNQDRDREEFAASLSKRYTHNTSVPRCDIPCKNWHKLMRNEPAPVFLHYYNREDAEQASHIFRDDLGDPLELRLSLKAGVVIRASSFSAVGPSIPRRSPSSERSVPETSPVLSQNSSPRNTSAWRRERLPVSKNDNRYTKYGPPSLLPSSRGERQYNTFDGRGKRSRAMVESRSRSRSRSKSKSFRDRRNGPNAYEGRADQGNFKRRRTSPLVPDTRERTASGNENPSSAIYSDADTLARKRARSSSRSPRRTPIFGLDTSKRELKMDNERRRQEEGEITRKSEIKPVRTMIERDRRSGLHRARSPSRKWQQEPIDIEESPRRDNFSNTICARSRSPAARHRFDQQWSNRNTDNKQRSRSRSRSRPEPLPMQNKRGGNYSDQYNLHRGFREYERADAYDDGTRGHNMYVNRGRSDYDGRRGGSDLRPRQ